MQDYLRRSRIGQGLGLILMAMIVGQSLGIASFFLNPTQVSAKEKRQPTTCLEAPQVYVTEFRTTRKPLAMLCYQYAAQRDPNTIEPVKTAQIDRKKLVDIFGKPVGDKQVFEEAWQPLPGFGGTFYDAKTLSRFYTGGKNMLQIPGISTLGDNPYKISTIVDCDVYTITYNGVAKRLTRVYDYSDRYQIPGKFERDRVEELCSDLGQPPVKIKL